MKKLINIIPKFIENVNQRRRLDYIRQHGTDTGYKDFTAYRFALDTGISHNTTYAYMNNPDKIPSEQTLKIICEYYLVQPNEVIALVDVADTE